MKNTNENYKKTLAVIFGGYSTEYDVSLQSAYSVISNINEDKYELVLIGITREGKWLRYKGNIENIRDDSWHTYKESCTNAVISHDRDIHGLIELDGNNTTTRIDIIFPVLHGKNGEDGTVQGIAEIAGIPVVGCGVLSSALCMDKDRAHKLVNYEGIETPKSAVMRKEETENLFFKIKDMQYPLFVKPVRAGSSFGITKVFKEEDLTGAVKNAFLHDETVIIEENVEGFEVGCAVIGNYELIIGEVDEIELSDGFFDYTEKYTLKSSKIHMPARISKEESDEIKETALKIYKILDCKGFARVDMFLTPDGRIVFNEVNTIPGFTSHSRFPNMMKGKGYSFKDILSHLLG